ncbi:BspA family leucine-rich repeat surface protein, partial [Mycoplasma leachii]|uniref:BspA family leucine-rich repeat surface protein n=1 Tax=Mycoplasma leachii TaxID=2105 RepID=UPI000D1D76F2
MKKLLTILANFSAIFLFSTTILLISKSSDQFELITYKNRFKSREHKIDNGVLKEVGYDVLSNGTIQIKRIDYKVKTIAAPLPEEITSLKNAFLTNNNIIKWQTEWDTKNITDMSYAFYNTIWINEKSIAKWNTSNVTNMEGMFGLTKSFDQDLSGWDVSKVVNFKNMFDRAKKFNNENKPLNWNSKLKSAKNMQGMFRSTNSFNQDISEWDVSNVADMSKLFENAYAFNNGEKPLDWGHKLKSIKNMSSMFNGASKFTHNLSSWLMNDIVKNDNFGLNKEKQPKWKVEEKKPVNDSLTQPQPNSSSDNSLPRENSESSSISNTEAESALPKVDKTKKQSEAKNKIPVEKGELPKDENQTTKTSNAIKDKENSSIKSDSLYKIPSKPNTIISKPSSPNAGIIAGSVLGSFTILGTTAGLSYYYRKNLKNLYLKSTDKLKPSLLKSKDNIKDFYVKSIDKTKNLYFKSKNKIKDKIAK